MTILFIKNMVCNRCIMTVESQLEKLNLKIKDIQLGEVTLEENLTTEQKEELNHALRSFGFEIIDDKKSRLIEQIKKQIIELVHNLNNDFKTNLSDLLSNRLNHDYNYLSNLFSDVEGRTIENYFIAQKIEKVKELLVYDELTLSEIAFKMNYSSVAYLSNQFKKVTGLTPSHFKKIRKNRRQPLDQV